MGKFISFEEVEQLATIDQLAQMLNLPVKQSGKQLRCSCPVHGGDERALAISPDVRSRRGAGPEGVFFCQSSKSGGDRIGLVAHCMEIGQQDAAFFIQNQFGAEDTVNSTSNSNSTVSKERATVPQAARLEPTSPISSRKSAPFDPAAFAAKLIYSEEVKALGFTEDDAERFCVGSYRGKVYFPMRDANGFVAGFIGYAEGQIKLPPQWLSAPSNVVSMRRA